MSISIIVSMLPSRLLTLLPLSLVLVRLLLLLCAFVPVRNHGQLVRTKTSTISFLLPSSTSIATISSSSHHRHHLFKHSITSPSSSSLDLNQLRFLLWVTTSIACTLLERQSATAFHLLRFRSSVAAFAPHRSSATLDSLLVVAFSSDTFFLCGFSGVEINLLQPSLVVIIITILIDQRLHHLSLFFLNRSSSSTSPLLSVFNENFTPVSRSFLIVSSSLAAAAWFSNLLMLSSFFNSTGLHLKQLQVTGSHHIPLLRCSPLWAFFSGYFQATVSGFCHLWSSQFHEIGWPCFCFG